MFAVQEFLSLVLSFLDLDLGAMKKALKRKPILNNDKIKRVTCTRKRKQPGKFYKVGLYAVIQKGNITIGNKRDHVEE